MVALTASSRDSTTSSVEGGDGASAPRGTLQHRRAANRVSPQQRRKVTRRRKIVQTTAAFKASLVEAGMQIGPILAFRGMDGEHDGSDVSFLSRCRPLRAVRLQI